MATLQQPQQPYNLFGPQMFEHQGKQAQYQPNTVINQSNTDTSQPNTNTATANNSTPQEAQFKLERDHQGNYYTNGVKTPMHVFNPDAVPYIKDEQQQNNKPITSMEELARAMGYTSPEDERKMRRASLMNQRILAVGDALRHIGNIANTVGYAPAQKFNNPVLEEEARYQKGKALRDRANQQYIAYQQAKDKQDAEQRRWEAQFNYNQAKDERNYKFNAAKAAAELAERQRQYDKTFGFNQQKHKDDVEYKNLTAKETARHHRALESTSRAGLAETIRHHKEVEANGGTAKGSFPVKSPYGKMRVPGRSIPQAQLNQAYKDFENAGWIKQDEFKKRMAEMGIGAKADPDYVRNRIIEEVISSNGEASDYMRDNFGWQYEDDPRGAGAMLMDEPQHATGLFSAPWNNNRGNPFEERQQPTNSNNHKSNPFG